MIGAKSSNALRMNARCTWRHREGSQNVYNTAIRRALSPSRPCGRVTAGVHGCPRGGAPIRHHTVVYLYRAGNSVACKTGIMPPFHHHRRGQRDGITPLFLPAGAVGSALALLQVALCVAQRARRRPPEAPPASPTTPQVPPCPEALSWPPPQAPLRRV